MMTKHSQKRIKERMGYRGTTAERVVSNALERGFTLESAPNFLQRDYLKRKISPGYTPILYQGHCFIFAQDRCVTVLDMPCYLQHKPINRGKERVRHPQKYFKLYGFPDKWALSARQYDFYYEQDMCEKEHII